MIHVVGQSYRYYAHLIGFTSVRHTIVIQASRCSRNSTKSFPRPFPTLSPPLPPISALVSGCRYGHSSRVTQCRFHPMGRFAVSSSTDGTIKLWDAMVGRLWRTMRGHNSAVLGVDFSTDGKTIVSCSVSHIVMVNDTRTGEMLRRCVGSRWSNPCPGVYTHTTSVCTRWVFSEAWPRG